MARIRSIKPDFFTSEVVAAQPLSARLTFIGLWTYVDDNGVGLDNDRLIVAAVWPLEDDPLETLRRTREDLQSLQEALLITRYSHSGKRLLHIRSWVEHQKVSHPGKPRYPLPFTSEDANPPETLRKPSGGLQRPSALSREQGAGSRDIQHAPRAAAGKPRRPAIPPDAELTVNQRAKVITDAYYEREPMSKWPAVNAVVIRALKDGRWPDEQIQAALLRMATENRSVTIDAIRTELNGFAPPRTSTTTDRAHQAIEAGRRVQAMIQGDGR